MINNKITKIIDGALIEKLVIKNQKPYITSVKYSSIDYYDSFK